MIKNADKGEVLYGCKSTAILHLDLGRKEKAEDFARLYVKGSVPFGFGFYTLLLFEMCYKPYATNSMLK